MKLTRFTVVYFDYYLVLKIKIKLSSSELQKISSLQAPLEKKEDQASLNRELHSQTLQSSLASNASGWNGRPGTKKIGQKGSSAGACKCNVITRLAVRWFQTAHRALPVWLPGERVLCTPQCISITIHFHSTRLPAESTAYSWRCNFPPI
jgi:hypothetical protein